MNLDQLDALLKQPLAPVADNGFTARVIAKVQAEERRHAWIVAFGALTAATLICLLVPVKAITGDFAAALVQLALSPMVGMALIVCIATFLIDRLFSDRKFLQV